MIVLNMPSARIAISSMPHLGILLMLLLLCTPSDGPWLDMVSCMVDMSCMVDVSR